MALDWRDIRDQGVPVHKALDSDGHELAVARAGHHHDGYPLWYGCDWQTFDRIGDLSCSSRYYQKHEIFFDDDIE